MTGTDSGFESSWGIVKDWSESSRYENDKGSGPALYEWPTYPARQSGKRCISC
jgi:hypothetical protein